MSGDLRTLLLETTPDAVADLDVDRLVRRGGRRRRAKRTGAAVAVLALLTTGSVAVLAGGPGDRVEIAPLDEAADLIPTDAWQPLPPAHMGPREGATVATDGDLVAFYGGTSDEEIEVDGTTWTSLILTDGAIYDVGADAWRAIPTGPLPARAGPHVELAGGQLLVVGGRELRPISGAGGLPAGEQAVTLESSRFDLRADVWRPMGAPDIAPRTPEIVAWDGERLVLWGGWADGGALMDGATWTEDDGWNAIPEAPLEARSGAAVAVVGDALVVWGGSRDRESSKATDLFADGAVFDLTAGEWTILPESPLSARWIGNDERQPRGNVRVDGDRVLIVGGVTTTGGPQARDGAWLDLADRSWTPITPAPGDATFVTARRGGVLAVDDHVTDAAPYVTLWRYDEARDGWDRSITRLRRAGFEIHDLSSERILVSSDGDEGHAQDAPRLGIWEADDHRVAHTGAPLSGRMHATIAPLPDGALVWGGREIETRGGEYVDARAVGDGARLDR